MTYLIQPARISIKHHWLARCALVLLTLSLFAGCSSTSDRRTKIETHSTDTSTDFSDLKTYRWDFSNIKKVVPEGGHTQELNRVVCEYMDMLMNDRGFKRVANGRADFTLDYSIAITQEEAAENETTLDNNSEANNYGLRWTFQKDELPTFKGLQAPKDQTVVYRRGELHIAAFNAQGEIIWHTSATRILDGRANEAERRAALRIAMDKMIKTFPASPTE